ncbi:oligosaccharide flippase family protein [Clostridium chauvoei]|uniref:Oligosaccharide flippase family protein n=2 Tax=Clostridium chauvoei TaxID=46867 RepID=A0ABD4REU1_9CLOT|nr:oligosaccharide flippase family protein [Clostridium chauvoei]ATD54264.1 hypothetical protein BTM20_03040 [Clostridium chauvoei]MBX7279871.1 oligosaccharide flippase family protein [Clostridium chauvoei]MBX7282211.1 oligosaccharide flippase family protein [Clostridium chauvoei]MBX7284761.1 oligosaccharide flippase family protein [Clostridium chauvoei]MBX7287119.1 oligosaccharide flippase family protein [Clostridium chauvoei]
MINSSKKLQKDFVSYFISNFVPLIMNLLAVYIYTAILKTDEFGEYNIVISTYTIISMFLFEWIGQGIMRFMPIYEKEGTTPILMKIVKVINTLILAFVVLFVIQKVCIRYNVLDELIIGALYVLTSGVFLILTSILRAKLNSGLFLKVSLFQSVINCVISIGLLINFKSFWMIVISKVITNIIAIIYLIREINKSKIIANDEIKITKDKLKKILMEMLKYGFPIILTGIGSMGLKIGDRYIIKYILGNSGVGIYTSNYMISENITMVLFGPIMTAAHTLMINLYEKNQIEELKNMLLQIKKSSILLFIPIIMYITLFHKNTSNIFISKSYDVGSLVIPITLLGIFLFNYGLYNFKIYEFKLKSMKITNVITICFFINIVLNICLITKLNIYGAALSTTSAYAIFFIISVYVNKKEKFINRIENKFTIKLIINNLVLFIIWLTIKFFSNKLLRIDNYLENIIFVIFTATPVFLGYLYISVFKLKMIKLK